MAGILCARATFALPGQRSVGARIAFLSFYSSLWLLEVQILDQSHYLGMEFFWNLIKLLLIQLHLSVAIFILILCSHAQLLAQRFGAW